MLETTLIRRFNYGLQGNQMYVHERLQIFKKYTSVMICSILKALNHKLIAGELCAIAMVTFLHHSKMQFPRTKKNRTFYKINYWQEKLSLL